MENTRQYPNNKYNSSGVRRDDQRDLDIIFGHLPDDNIFTKCGKGFAGGYSTDWLKPDNFLSKKEAREWISEGGNIGLAIGRFFGDTAYVNFDIDSPDALEGEARAILESHAPFKISTKHNNTNYIVSVDNREALEILDAYPTTLDHLSDGESDDLEIFANQFHALIPPSKVHHRTCSGSKPCSPSDGQGRYLFQSVNKNSKPLSLSTVERLGELWKIEPEVIGSSYPEPDETANVPSVGPSVNVIKEFQVLY